MPDFLIRWTVRLALAAYAVRLGADLRCWGAGVHWRTPVVRACWVAGSLLLAVHVALAFHFVHHWSQAHAYAETAQRTVALTGWDWGGGVYLNELTVVLWCADAAWMVLALDNYARRSALNGGMLHAWLSFMAFNGAVVFERGPTRWVTLAVSVVMLLIVARRYWQSQSRSWN